MVHGDGQVVPFFLWNGVVGDACGDVGESLTPGFGAVVPPPSLSDAWRLRLTRCLPSSREASSPCRAVVGPQGTS